MRQNRIPAKPLYVQEGIPDNYRYSGVSHTNIHYHKVGAGWLVREMSYDYEDGLTPGLFLTEDGRLSNCGEAKNGQLGTSSIRDAEYYEVQGIQTKESTYADSEHTMFAGDAGLEILAHGLAMHHIVG
jgi:alpha-tubulin suppressor-like RCC1 family protein